MARYNVQKIGTGSFTSMNSSKARLGSKLLGAVLGAVIIGLSLAPLPATAGESISTISQKIEAALEAASLARVAYTSYSKAATNDCLTLANKSVICVVLFSEQRVTDTNTMAVYTPPSR